MSRLTVAVTFLTLLTTLTAQRQGREGGGRFGRDRDAEPQKLENFTFEQGTFTSAKVTRGEPGYGIYLPKGYADEANKDTKYPWVLWLHGFGGFGEFQGGGGADVLDKLAGEGKLPPLVMVVFRSPGGRTTYMNGEAAGDIEDVIVGDLVTHLQGKYRLQQERAQRAVMGVSMGGMGAMKIAMRHPEVFGTIAVHSSAILPADPAELPERYARQARMMLQRGLDKVFGDPIDKAKWQEQMPMGLVATRKPEQFAGIHIYFDAGTEDGYGFCEPNKRLDALMTEKGLAHCFREIDGGGHAWSSPTMKDNLSQSLQFVGAALQGKDPKAALEALEAAAKKRKEAAPADGPKKTDGGK